uniref:BZIP domain-containing protein n=2 Tax=Strongyloides stercoralis TaxID=6248 RepID=A0AAF5DLI7_STRER
MENNRFSSVFICKITLSENFEKSDSNKIISYRLVQQNDLPMEKNNENLLNTNFKNENKFSISSRQKRQARPRQRRRLIQGLRRERRERRIRQREQQSRRAERAKKQKAYLRGNEQKARERRRTFIQNERARLENFARERAERQTTTTTTTTTTASTTTTPTTTSTTPTTTPAPTTKNGKK